MRVAAIGDIVTVRCSYRIFQAVVEDVREWDGSIVCRDRNGDEWKISNRGYKVVCPLSAQRVGQYRLDR